MKHNNSVFIGFDYIDYFINIIDKEITPFLNSKSITVHYPLNKTPGGDLINRIFQMLLQSNASLFECTTLNPNVIYELGYAIGKKHNFYIMYNSNFLDREELPNILKTTWGIWYNSVNELQQKLQFIGNNIYESVNEESQEKPSLEIKINIDSILLIIDRNQNYIEEIQKIKEAFKHSRINIIRIEQFEDIGHLFTCISKESIIITILNPILNKSDKMFSEINKLNALKLLCIGIAQGLYKNILLFQEGAKTYSDIVSISKHYENLDDFNRVIFEWNEMVTKNIIEKIFNDRIGIPNLGKLIKRQRLTNYIKENIFFKKIFLRAPSGYGKSAIAINVLKEIKLPTIWYTFDKSIDNNVEIIKDIFSELNKYDKECGKALNSILSLFVKNEISEHVLLNYFFNEINNIKEKIIIVFDDIHNLNTDLSKFITQLIKFQFENLGLILISREEFEMSMEDKNKNIVALQKTELEFTKEEIAEYFINNFNIDITGEELNIIFNKSEGWIAGISLLQSIIARYDRNSVKQIIENLKASNKTIYDYFAEIVYSDFELDIKKYLRKSSILRIITPKIFSYLIDKPIEDSIEILNQVEKQNSFLFNYENNPNMFNYHSLFKDFLLRKYIEIEGAEKILKAKFELSNVYYKEKEYFDSLNLGLESKNFETAVNSIDKIGNFIVNEGLYKLVMNWIAQIPQNYYKNNFNFYVIKGRAEEGMNKFSIAKVSYQMAKQILDTTPDVEKEKNLVDFFVLNLSTNDSEDLYSKQEKLIQITKNAKLYNDNETYFYASSLYFQIRRKVFLTNALSKENDIKDAEVLLQEIDKVIIELKECNLDAKYLYISQILIDKALITHNIEFLKASEYLLKTNFQEKLMNKNIKPEDLLKKLSQFFSKSILYFDEALEIAQSNKFNLVIANILVSKTELYESRSIFYYINLGIKDFDSYNNSIKDLEVALKIYLSLDHIYGVAIIYNNMANLYLGYNNKILSRKYANLAIDIGKKYDFPDIIEKSLKILKSPTLNEQIRNSQEAINKRLINGIISNEEREELIKNLLSTMDNLSDSEKVEKRKIIDIEIEDMRIGHEISKNWCKYCFLFHTRSPLSQHPIIDEKMVKSYIERNKLSEQIYNAPQKELFKQTNAKFIMCNKLGFHSKNLSDNVAELRDEFIVNFCLNCKQREIE